MKTQRLVAISTYLLFSTAKIRLHIDHYSLHRILKLLSILMLETIPINQLREPPATNSEPLFKRLRVVHHSTANGMRIEPGIDLLELQTPQNDVFDLDIFVMAASRHLTVAKLAVAQ